MLGILLHLLHFIAGNSTNSQADMKPPPPACYAILIAENGMHPKPRLPNAYWWLQLLLPSRQPLCAQHLLESVSICTNFFTSRALVRCVYKLCWCHTYTGVSWNDFFEFGKGIIPYQRYGSGKGRKNEINPFSRFWNLKGIKKTIPKI